MGETMLRNSGDVAALEFHAAARRRQRAGQQVEISALAGAVGADDRRDRALGEFGGNIAQRDEFAEHLADAPGAQDDLSRWRAGIGHGLGHGLPREISVPQIPAGKNSTQIMKMAPTMSCQCTVHTEKSISRTRT